MVLLFRDAITGSFARSIGRSTFVLPPFVGLALLSQEIVDVYEGVGLLDCGFSASGSLLEWRVRHIDLILNYGCGVLGLA